MVSLNEDSKLQTQGFQIGIDGSINSDDDDTTGLVNPQLALNEGPKFQPIRTSWAIALCILLAVALEIAAFLLPYFDEHITGTLSTYSLLLYLHAIVWLVFLIVDAYCQRRHQELRNNGYLEFYRHTKTIRRSPLLLISAGNVLLLVLSTLLTDYCTSEQLCGSSTLKRVNYIQMAFTLEFLVVLPCLLVYLGMYVNNRDSKCFVRSSPLLTII